MSASSNNNLFLRRWSLTVKGPSNAASPTQTVIQLTSDSQSESLRVRFDVQTFFMQWYWMADIEIWNPNAQLTNFFLTQGNTSGNASPTSSAPGPATNSPLQQGMEVELQAGYQAPNPFGTIWAGYVLQPMFERRTQTDFVVTLHCIIGLDQMTRNSLGRTYEAGTTQLAIVQSMAKNAYHPIDTGTLASKLGNKSLSRAKTVFGTPSKYLNEIVRDNNMQWWLDQHGLLNVADLAHNFPTAPKYTFTPTTGIIGTPQQTQLGVNLRLLLNPNVIVSNPPMAIKIDNTVIRQLQRNVGDQASAASLLSQDGVYVVVGARYIGDTRGQEWYTEVTGWLTAYDKVAAIAAATGVQFDRP